MNTENMTPTELRELADRIEREAEIKKKQKDAPVALPLDKINVNKFFLFAEEIKNDILAGNYNLDGDAEHWAWELVMESVYGEDFWDWYNENVD
tara:strand:+ start:34 stop:315 length:282 start_codon:yes stop_codon:yes gene_type:complete